jgi:hypothetical protein
MELKASPGPSGNAFVDFLAVLCESVKMFGYTMILIASHP